MNKGCPKTLYIHFHVEFCRVAGGYIFPHYIASWLEGLSKGFDKIIYIGYSTKYAEYGTLVDNNRISVIDLGVKGSIISRVLSAKATSAKLISLFENNSILLCRVPSPLAVSLLNSAKKKSIHVATFFVADMVASLPTARKLNGVVKTAIWQAYWLIDTLRLIRIANKGLVMVNGPYFNRSHRLLKHQNVVHSSTVCRSEILAPRVALGKDRVVIGMVGRLSPSKGIEDFLFAIAKVQISIEGLRVTGAIVGGGDQRYLEHLKGLASKLGVNVEFTDQIHEKSLLFSKMREFDIFIQPALFDVQPRTIWEAMAVGIPVVVSSGCVSHCERFANFNGFHQFELGNADELASRIRHLILDEHNYREACVFSHQTINDFTEETSISMQLGLLRDLV